MQPNIRPAVITDCGEVCALLSTNKLPVDDIDKTLPHFFVAEIDKRIAGVIGLEVYEQFGLLRSMATKQEYRNYGIATGLVNTLMQYAATTGLKEIYLLTETAKEYFEKKAFAVVERTQVPSAVQQSAEFSHVCPSHAVVMKKNLA
jgi:amino-acid N-acetyltransferase